MNIGFVSTWFERGAAYVTKQYLSVIEKSGHNTYVYARGESFAKGSEKWDLPYVTWGKKLYETSIDLRDFDKWIESNGLDCVFFNEQRDLLPILHLREKYSGIKIGTYIDYYTQNTVKSFELYDFLICNTKRHYSVFSWHPQCYYVPWGTDTNIFTYDDKSCANGEIRFFHSAGMSNRKGTDVLVDTFIDYNLWKESKLIIHTQLPIDKLINRDVENYKRYNIEIIEETVPAPGLYHLGDIYVYPTTLDGLGLTMYEAYACGLPVIATNCAPMNEIVNNSIGRLVDVEKYVCRYDGYYWPLAIVDKESLAKSMSYYIDSKDKLSAFRKEARMYAESHFNWEDRAEELNTIITTVKHLEVSRNAQIEYKKKIKLKKRNELGKALLNYVPNWMQEYYFRNR